MAVFPDRKARSASQSRRWRIGWPRAQIDWHRTHRWSNQLRWQFIHHRRGPNVPGNEWLCIDRRRVFGGARRGFTTIEWEPLEQSIQDHGFGMSIARRMLMIGSWHFEPLGSGNRNDRYIDRCRGSTLRARHRHREPSGRDGEERHDAQYERHTLPRGRDIRRYPPVERYCSSHGNDTPVIAVDREEKHVRGQRTLASPCASTHSNPVRSERDILPPPIHCTNRCTGSGTTCSHLPHRGHRRSLPLFRSSDSR